MGSLDSVRIKRLFGEVSPTSVVVLETPPLHNGALKILYTVGSISQVLIVVALANWRYTKLSLAYAPLVFVLRACVYTRCTRSLHPSYPFWRLFFLFFSLFPFLFVVFTRGPLGNDF